MTLEFTFSQEQLDALTASTNALNAALPEGSVAYSVEDYLKLVTIRLVNEQVDLQYRQAVERLSEAVRNLPYAERLARVAALETQLS
jgi:hypothetical protein